MQLLAISSLHRFLFIFSIVFYFNSNLNAQFTSWTGATNTDWNTASNWTAGVPLATTEVNIGDVTNDPIISTAAVAQTVFIDVGGRLTILATFSLTIISSTSTQSIWN